METEYDGFMVGDIVAFYTVPEYEGTIIGFHENVLGDMDPVICWDDDIDLAMAENPRNLDLVKAAPEVLLDKLGTSDSCAI